MNIPKELVDQWEIDWQDPDAKGSLNEYIAQRAAEWALSQPVSMEPDQRFVNLLCRIHRDGGHYIAEHGIDKAAEAADILVAELNAKYGDPPEPVSMEPVGEVVREGIISWKCKYPAVGTKLYTATQLAQARQQGAEEERAKLNLDRQTITDPAEIRRVFEIDEADYPPPDSGFAKL